MKNRFKIAYVALSGLFVCASLFSSCSKDDDGDDTTTPAQNTDTTTNNNGGSTNNNGGSTTDTTNNNNGNTGTKYTCLEGSDYYVFLMDATTFASLGDKVTVDARPDGEYGAAGTTCSFEVWGTTLVSGQCAGTNFFGLEEDWFCMASSSKVSQWNNGCGGFRLFKNLDWSTVQDDYVFHLAYKGTTDTQLHIKFIDTEIASVSTATDGVWKTIELEVGDLKDKGVKFDNYTYDANAAYYPVQLVIDGYDNTINVDAIFIYKKN